MRDLWDRLEGWFRARASVALGLRPGADEATLAAAEETIGRRLPEDLRESLATHDGHQPDAAFTFLPDGMTLHSAARIAEEWQALRPFALDEDWARQPATDRRLRAAVHDPRRVPIAASEQASAWIFLDYYPGPEGADGQLIHNVTECDFRVVAPDFRTLLSTYVELLEAGELVWHTDARYREAGFVVPAGAEATFPRVRLGEFLAARCGAPSPRPSPTWKVGDAVRVTNGAHQGQLGHVRAVEAGLVRVELSLFGRPVAVELRPSDLAAR